MHFFDPNPKYQNVDPKLRRYHTAQDHVTDAYSMAVDLRTGKLRPQPDGWTFLARLRWHLLNVEGNFGEHREIRSLARSTRDSLPTMFPADELTVREMFANVAFLMHLAGSISPQDHRSTDDRYDHLKAVSLRQLQGRTGAEKCDSLCELLDEMIRVHHTDPDRLAVLVGLSGDLQGFLNATLQAAQFLLGHLEGPKQLFRKIFQQASERLDQSRLVEWSQSIVDMLRSNSNESQAHSMLMYLDTAQLAYVDGAINSSCERQNEVATQFFALLEHAQIAIALTEVHVYETAQSGSSEHLEARARILDAAPTAYVFGGGMPDLVWLEFVVQSQARRTRQPLQPSGFIRFIRGLLWRTSSSGGLKTRFENATKRAQWAAEGARLASLFENTANDDGDLDEVDPEFQRKLIEMLHELLEHSSRDPGPTNEHVIRMRKRIDRANDFPRTTLNLKLRDRAERKKFAREVLRPFRAVAKAPAEDRSLLFLMFDDLVARVSGGALTTLVPNSEEWREIAEGFDPYDSPGSAHLLAANRGVSRRGTKRVASDYMDAAHVAFAPYVDLMLVDKRTFGYIESEQSNRKRKEFNRHLDTSRIWKVQSLSDLVVRLTALAG